MKIVVLLSFLLVFSLYSVCVSSSESEDGLLNHGRRHAVLPPRGWNSYDSFCWTISEQDFLDSATIISKRLLSHRYEFAVVDYLWYRRKVPGAYVDSLGFDVIDYWGRMVPDPDRWPSSKDGKGFTLVADKVHAMGLKFGIHVMRGLSTQAYDANTLILDVDTGRPYEENGRQWRTQDIGLKEKACAWMKNGFMSVNTKLGAGRAFLKSLYKQYAEWGVDLVKHDCVFGDDLDIDEISFVSEVLKKLDRPIWYSLSPGTSVTPAMAKDVSGLANMYRITGDDWDTWADVVSHFDVSRDFATANMIGSRGLQGNSWPDLDMLPLGWLTDPGSNDGPHRASNLNQDEQRTQMTLWAMAKSPLMFGGDVRNLDDNTYNLITNPTLLEINSFSYNNVEFSYVTSTEVSARNERFSSSASERHIFGLTSCNNEKVTGWSAKALDQDVEQICWKDSLGSGPLCVYKQKPRLSSDEEALYNRHYPGKLHLVSNDESNFCLDASPQKKLTSKDVNRISFTPCRWDTNQFWDLNATGALVNSYSGQCAILKAIKANDVSNGFRSWIATGRKGEIYMAFFNLNQVQRVISTTIADLAKALPRKYLNITSCKAREIWSGKDYGVTKQSETHSSVIPQRASLRVYWGHATSLFDDGDSYSTNRSVNKTECSAYA
ncbi:hypothetical protein ACFE04_024501 [Oxalis oulophora]